MQFAAHTQAMTDEEHQLLDRSTAPLKRQGFPLDKPADHVSTASLLQIKQAPAVHHVALSEACATWHT